MLPEDVRSHMLLRLNAAARWRQHSFRFSPPSFGIPRRICGTLPRIVCNVPRRAFRIRSRRRRKLLRTARRSAPRTRCRGTSDALRERKRRRNRDRARCSEPSSSRPVRAGTPTRSFRMRRRNRCRHAYNFGISRVTFSAFLVSEQSRTRFSPNPSSARSPSSDP